MIKQTLINTTIIFITLLTQLIILYFFSKEKNKPELKDNVVSFIVASFFIGITLSLTSKLSNYIDYKIISFILVSSTISAYWFIIEPFKYLLKKKEYYRDTELEKELSIKGYHYKILFTDQIITNAYATGIIPFYKIIIVGNNLKDSLTPSQLKALIFHEIGHHRKKHILKLFFINIILQTAFIIIFSLIYNLHITNTLIELTLVALTGGMGGFLFWFIPNKISFYFEYYADEYSALNFSRRSLINALIKLDELSEGKLTRGNYSHPKIEKRLNNLVKNESK